MFTDAYRARRFKTLLEQHAVRLTAQEAGQLYADVDAINAARGQLRRERL